MALRNWRSGRSGACSVDVRLDRRRRLQERSLTTLHRLNVSPCPTTHCRIATATQRVTRGFSRAGNGCKSIHVTNHVVAHHVVNDTSFFRLRSRANHVRICVHHSSVYPRNSPALCGAIFGGLLSVNSFVNIRNFTFRAGANRLSIRYHGFAILSGSVHPLPIIGRGSNRAFSTFASPRIHCHRHCISLTIGPRMHRIFIGHTGVVSAVHRFFGSGNCIRIRAPVLRPVPNNTTTHPFVARRGTLSVSRCLHVTDRLCLGGLVINKFSNICRFNGGFHGRNVSHARGPRFAIVRVCITCGSCL